VHGLAGVPESGRSEGACLESLKGIKGVAERKNRDKIEVGLIDLVDCESS
jgi:hypothetical protein